MEVDQAEGAGRVRGFASSPPLGRADRKHQLFFVNRRPVKDKTIGAALQQAYRGLLERDLSPEAYLFFEVPCGEVDVNVHPSKTEVRFRRSSDIFQLVLRAVERARLKSGGLVEVAPVYPPAVRPETPAIQMGLGVPFAVGEAAAPFELPTSESPQPGKTGQEESSRRVLGQYRRRLHRRRGRRGDPGRRPAQRPRARPL